MIFKETEAEFKEFEPRFKLKIVSNVSRFKPALNLNRVLVDLSRDINSLNSVSVCVILSNPPCKDGNNRFTTVPFKPL